MVTGLAYSGSGNGGILFVEATKMPGDGKICLTGSLGNVIQESAQIALSWVKAHAYSLRLTASKKEKLAQEDDIHIHFPSGSIPKDGPSAGKRKMLFMVKENGLINEKKKVSHWYVRLFHFILVKGYQQPQP